MPQTAIRTRNQTAMDPPEWLQEGNSSHQRLTEPSDSSNLPDWLKEATTDTSQQKKPKKKLAYIAPIRRESNDRSSFSGPINDPAPPPTSFPNPRMSLLSSVTRPQTTNHTNNLSPISTSFGPTSILSPQKASTTYRSISIEDETEPAIIKGDHSELHMKDEESGEDDTASNLSYSQQKYRQSPSQTEETDVLTLWFRIFHLLAGLAATVSMVGNAYEVCQWANIGLRNSIIHLYAGVFCLVIVGIECEVPFLMHRLKLFDWWVVRGLMYIFIGALTIDPAEENSLEHQSASDKNMKLTQNIAGIVLSLVAVLYIVMGLLCMKALRDKKLAHLPLLGSEPIIF